MHEAARTTLRPLATTELVPLAAAGRQPLFFYGTLMDLDVLARVLQRPLAMDDLVPASVRGFARRRAARASYPVLVPDRAGTVDGLLLRRATGRDIRRINHFESEEYRAELRPVALPDGRTVPAWLFLGMAGRVAPSRDAWSLERWQRAHKRGFLARCDIWMADCVD